MYKIYKNSDVIAVVEKPVYIRKHPSQPWYTAANEHNAEGISVLGLGVYALMGRELDGLEKVALVKVDGGVVINEAMRGNEKIRADVDYMSIMLDVDLSNEEEEEEYEVEEL